MSVFFRAAAIALLSAAVLPAAAFAKDTRIVMPATALKNADTRVCMPRKLSQTIGKDKSQPATLCETVSGWATHGVTVVAK